MPAAHTRTSGDRLRPLIYQDNICRLLESYQDPQHICLVLEYIDGGDLLDYIMDYKGDGLRELNESVLKLTISGGGSGRPDVSDLSGDGVLRELFRGVAQLTTARERDHAPRPQA